MAFIINEKTKTPNKIIKISLSIWALTFILFLFSPDSIASYFFFSGLPVADIGGLAAIQVENIRKNPQRYVSQEYETMFKRFLKAEKSFV